MVFDEVHKNIENDDLVSGLVEVVREMCHKGISNMVPRLFMGHVDKGFQPGVFVRSEPGFS